MIIHHEVVSPFAENALLVGCPEESRAVLVDPGGRVEELLAAAGERDLTVEAIWLTHAHVDHVMGVAEAVRRVGGPVLLHRDDEALYRGAAEQARFFGIEIEPPPPVDEWIEPGRVLEIGRLRAEVLHVPGHSPGHVAFWFDGPGVVLAGDCLFAGSIGRTDLPGGSHETLMRSIREVLVPLGRDVRVIPGHGPETTIGRELDGNPFLQGVGA